MLRSVAVSLGLSTNLATLTFYSSFWFWDNDRETVWLTITKCSLLAVVKYFIYCQNWWSSGSFNKTLRRLLYWIIFCKNISPYLIKLPWNKWIIPLPKFLTEKKQQFLLEFLTIKLKFTIYTLVNWFDSVIKQIFLELNDFQKRAFIKKIP